VTCSLKLIPEKGHMVGLGFNVPRGLRENPFNCPVSYHSIYLVLLLL